MQLFGRPIASLACLMLAGWLFTAECPPTRGADIESSGEPWLELQKRVDQLIEQLGAANYASRERAHTELKRIGSSAFDALYRAQEHDDVEIAQRARYLLRSLDIEWAGPDDPTIVHGIMHQYGDLDEDARKSRMDRLAALDDGVGIEALCRIVRFERSLRMSKEAAVRVVRLAAPTDPALRTALIRNIRASLTVSQRPSAKWLLTYADTLEDPASTVDTWDQLVKAEYEAYNLFPDRSEREIVRDLLQFQADLLAQLGRDDEASAAMLRWVDYGESNKTELLEAVQWLVRREAWTVVNDLITRNAAVFDNDAELLYLAADAYRRQGQSQRSEDAANQAAGLAIDDFKEHERIANLLEKRGLKEWAEREYRQVMDRAPPESVLSIRAHLTLAEMLHDDARDEAAAKVYQEFMKKMEKEPGIAQQLQYFRDPETVPARMHFFLAAHHRRQGDHAKEKEQMKLAVSHDAADADVLIGLYRAGDQDEAWRADAQQKIAAASEQMLQKVGLYRERYRQIQVTGETPEIKIVRTWLTGACNEYAWLISNTEGDFDEALRLSHESLELTPNSAGYLDTLAHCYHAKGDHEAALKYQRKAVKLEPHSGQISRALKRFEAAVEKPKEE